ncbi:MAG TPA: D-2-hydroxyacid dehydrogenase [Candidatus Anaerostipes avistercoris]|uniref:D-2-hydroxyacid dehydrogenase n=1 Tax=Candidatus Anaerostipes avistercoris TaxID=2838462 RepID=A0A9D2T951_9FIRM|nr:D-2-hydroxyacid dehydrogenase [uncultured Anaerostipes sp.]HJC50234.1 D-2-hydroxyacid dehydrogenase [Candidatus Anaerostipes avistercoris]
MIKGKKILVVLPVSEGQKEKLEEYADKSCFTYTSYKKATEEMVKEADIIIGNIDPDLLEYAEHLEWLQLNSAGADAYVKRGVLPENVMLTNATGAYGPGVAEHMLAVLFSLQKKLHLYRDNQNQCEWYDEGEVMSLRGGCALIVGLGDIGLYFARLLRNFGYRIIGIKRRPGQVPQGVDELYTMDHLDELLPEADVVFSILPETKVTKNLFNARRFREMKNSAIFLNAGRGSAVNTEDLCQALIAGEIYGAGLDVTDPEPLPSQHKLWNMQNVVITPHISGDFHHPATLYRIVDIVAGNLKRYCAGEPLINIVDRETGYRK